MESIWVESAPVVKFKPLNGDRNTDVLIIGGGIAGLLCAYKLWKAGVDCTLVEATGICQGITKNTTAKITLGHGLIYDKLIKTFGENKARLYLDAQIHALNEYSKLCKQIDCDYQIADNYVYSLNNKEVVTNEVSALRRLGINADLSDSGELPINVAGSVRVRGQATFHPLKFLYSISKDLPIFENTKVLELAPDKAITNRGVITYKKLVIATHFPFLNKHGGYFLKLYQHRSYVIALKGAQRINAMYVDESETGLSFRPHGDLLLLGGGGHRTGKQGGCWQELELFTEKYYKGAEIVSKWATQDCITLDGVPYIGQYSKSMPNTFVVTGFNKWGMTNAMVASDILSDLVRNRHNSYAEVFSPSRSILRSQLIKNAFESTVGLLTPTKPRCPHLGCALKYNRAEATWDCPCHGSCFGENGELIDNPATDDHLSIGG